MSSAVRCSAVQCSAAWSAVGRHLSAGLWPLPCQLRETSDAADLTLRFFSVLVCCTGSSRCSCASATGSVDMHWAPVGRLAQCAALCCAALRFAAARCDARTHWWWFLCVSVWSRPCYFCLFQGLFDILSQKDRVVRFSEETRRRDRDSLFYAPSVTSHAHRRQR